MGVPSFFRWLLEKYPRVIKYVKEEFMEYDDDGNRILPDASGKNPNGIEYDNLYLDMNGIIHPCCHPEGAPQPKTEDEMIMNVFKYIEHIFSMVRPRKLLYLAIDGVAPRAKMNQQRARRFRAAQEREELITTRKKLESYYHQKGWNVPTAPPPSWDHNVITPGTPFMDKLAESLRYWISYKLHNDSGWKGIKVILSDANIPGEGEHKIAAFIRRTRGLNGYDPNTKHVLYGLDADLFMLGLATHEIHFTILREEVLFGKNRPCAKCGIAGHFADRCTNDPKPSDLENNKKNKNKPFVFADLCVLREYLEYELKIDELEWWDLERIIDDFVFLCFFVGNDFLPHLPSLEIREGAIDNLLKYYKQFLPKFGGYLTESGGKVNLKRVNILLKQLGDIEDDVFKNRTESEQHKKRKNESRKNQKKKERIYQKREKNKTKNIRINNENSIDTYYDNNRQSMYDEINRINLNECKLDDEYDENQMEFMDFFNEYELDLDEHFMEKDFEHQLKAIHRASQDISKCKTIKKEEDLLFGTKGFKQRYYFKKMKINYDENPPLLETLIFEYVRGLCWVMLYYYQGCVSWSWYYPFHYAPFASDLNNIDRFANKFEFDKIKSKPFTPFGQLMGVLPASSGKIALPKEFSDLMTSPTSPIIDFYPTDFKLDLNGKLYNWQAVILLPFVDADRLCKTIKPLEDKLNDNLKRMNGLGQTLLYVNKSHPLSKSMVSIYEKKENEEVIPLDQQLSQGINGYIFNNEYTVKCGERLIAPQNVSTLVDIDNGVDVISCSYKLPAYNKHSCQLLDGIILPEPLLDATDFEHMEKAPRFGKPRTFRRRDTHFNYNRGWDANIGYQQGIYKAKHNKNLQFELNYQPTRREYNQMHEMSTSLNTSKSFTSKWVPKNRDNNNNNNNNNNDNIHSSTSNGNGPYKSTKKFPQFDPYPNKFNNNDNVYSHRPKNAPHSVDPNVDLSSSSYSRGSGGGGGGRNYNSRRNNNNYNQQHNQQHNQQYNQQYNQYYKNNNNQYQHNQYNNNTPIHQQWYPQQTYQHHQQQPYYNNNYYQHQQQQTPYYHHNNNQQYQQQYQQYQPHYQHNQYNQYQQHYNNNRSQQNQNQSQQQNNNNNSRKWG